MAWKVGQSVEWGEIDCQDLSLHLQDEIEDHAWVEEPATRGHPLHEITNSLCFAAAKVAGALNLQDFWPPIPILPPLGSPG